MLTTSERKRLDRIELVATANDAWFADGLRDGSPRLPREYRRRRVAIVALTASIAVLVGAAVLLVFGFLGAVMLVWPAVLASGWALHGPLRIRDGR